MPEYVDSMSYIRVLFYGTKREAGKMCNVGHRPSFIEQIDHMLVVPIVIVVKVIALVDRE